ncbi:putative DNA-binding transcriptional regulator YafY [Mucilaginibacter gracilis]|uniref:Putative DNA-binding transcriptional regulator YafY n=1 Tax=Mucilaginibacter gracilis TaxID=423350 RepID=A0A495IZG6_9SPHI|nr:YafY family protein [Mucilaginibacter gracilis]RKR81219.1 putative DNA-binding transcriptional regulator YafY [Mucilaginibacter gracilis]
MNRIDRLSAILIQLQSRRITKAQDVADRFNISLRTVYRDIKALEEAGIPIIGEAGIGYSIMDGYRLPPVMFTREEAIAFLTAEKMVERLTDAANSANYRSAMYKIKAVLRSTEKDLLENMDTHIEVLKGKHKADEKPQLDLIQPILKSITAGVVVSLKYFSNYRQQQTQRMVEPVGVFYLEGYWHLIAFCRMRNDYRDFRLDRVLAITLTDDVFKQKHPPLKEHLQKTYQNNNLQEVIIRVDKRAVPYLTEQKYYSGYVSERQVGDEVEMIFLTGALEGFARWYMMYGDMATIIKPDELIERVKAITCKTAEKLSISDGFLLT